MPDNCPLCLDVISEASTILKCGHKFCSECILNSVALNTGTEEGTSRNRCPLCRVPMCEEVEPSEKIKIRMGDLKYELETERITSERRKESLSILYDKITNIKDLFIKPAESALIGTKINVTKELEELVAILPDKRDINTETEYEAYPLVETDNPIESTNIVPYEPVRFTPLPPFRFVSYEPFRLVRQPSIIYNRLVEQLFSSNISYKWGWEQKREHSERDRKRGEKIEMDKYLKSNEDYGY